MKKTLKQHEYIKKWHSDILAAMKQIIESESYTQTQTDRELAEGIKKLGVFCDEFVVTRVRQEHKIGNRNARRITNYARDFKKGKLN